VRDRADLYNANSQDEISRLQFAEKLLELIGLLDSADWTQRTSDRKFNKRQYAVNNSKMHKPGCGKNGQVPTLLCR
jgi:dTDP-D-glucose 4,6-dehydratase